MTTVRTLLERKGRAIFSVEPQAAVLDAMRLIAALEGIVSERDYARKVILRGRSSADTPVGDIMSSPVLTVTLDTTVQQCMQLVTDRHVRHLPVLDGTRVVGMISIGDLVKAVIADQQQQIEQLETYIH